MDSHNFDDVSFGFTAPNSYDFNRYLSPSQPLVADPYDGPAQQISNGYQWAAAPTEFGKSCCGSFFSLCLTCDYQGPSQSPMG